MGKRVLGFFIGVGLAVGGILLAPVTGGISLSLVGVGLNMMTNAAFRPGQIDGKARDMRSMVVSPMASLPVIYGTAKIGVKIVDMRTDAGAPQDLYVVAALCHGSSNGLGISAIGKIWFDEQLAFDASGTLQAAFKKGSTPYATVTKYLGSGTQTADATLISRFTNIWTTNHTGRGVAYCVFKLTMNADIFQTIPQITVEVQGAQVFDPRATNPTYTWLNAGPLLVLDYLTNTIYGLSAGRKMEVPAGSVTGSGLTLTAANVVDGNFDTVGADTSTATAGAFIRFDFGEPRELDRVDIWSQRALGSTAQWLVQYSNTATAGYTSVVGLTAIGTSILRNTARWRTTVSGAHRYWQLLLNNTPGTGQANVMGVDWHETEIDYQSFIDYTNITQTTTVVPPADSVFKTATAAPTLSPLKLTVVTHGYTAGQTVALELSNAYSVSGLTVAGAPLEGNAYAITTSVDANNIILGVTATGSYTVNSLRTGVLVAEAMYATDGAVDTADYPSDNLTRLLSSFRGRLIYQNGRWRCHMHDVSAAAGPAFTDDDIVSIRYVVPGNREKFNRAKFTFLNPAKDYQPEQREWPRPNVPNTYLADDNGFESELDAEFPHVYSPYQADRIAQILLRESRDALSIEVVLSERGLLAQVGDLCSFSLAGPGWASKLFWIESVVLSPTGQPVILAVEATAGIYTITNSQLGSTLPATNLPDAQGVPAAPTSLNLAAGDSETIRQSNGELVFRILATWVNSTSPYLAYNEVQAKRTAEATYDTWGRPLLSDVTFYVSPVTYGESWDVRVRAVSTLGIPSDWVASTISSVGGSIAPLPTGVVEFFDTYPGTRWTDTGSGGASTVRASPDSQFGGKVLYCTGTRTGEWVPYIPFDVNKLYTIRGRTRCLRASSSTSPFQDFFLGFMAYDSGLNRLSINGAGSGGNSDRFACAASFSFVAESTAWTEFVGYIRGWGGSWYSPPTGVLTNNGLGSYSGTNVGDGVVAAGTAWDTNSATAGNNLTLDLGVGITNAFCRAKIFRPASTSTGACNYKLQYSASGTAWTDVTFRGGAVTWVPNLTDGWSEIDWTQNAGAFRYWRLLVNNTPGAGPVVTEFALLSISGVSQGAAPDPYAPAQITPGTAYIRPSFQTRGSTVQGYPVDAWWEIDMIEMPQAAGSTVLV